MTQRQAMEAWLGKAKESLKKSARENAYKSGMLERSIGGAILSEERVKLFYAIHGKYADMGVGGSKNSDAAKISGRKGKRRKSKKWATKQLYKVVWALTMAMSNQAQEIIFASIDRNIQNKIEL
jgi:hypothetical protein